MDKPTPHDLRIAYDRENDVLYVSLGEPMKSVCETLENGVVIKRDPSTDRINGLILIDVTHNFSSTHPRAIAPGLKAELLTT